MKIKLYNTEKKEWEKIKISLGSVLKIFFVGLIFYVAFLFMVAFGLIILGGLLGW